MVRVRREIQTDRRREKTASVRIGELVTGR